MFNPLDSSSVQSAYGGTRFSGGRKEEQDAMADFGDSYLMGGMGVRAAGDAAKNRVEAARRAHEYRKKQSGGGGGGGFLSGLLGGAASLIPGVGAVAGPIVSAATSRIFG
jgi:hypothetical protein